eukprot:145339-Rhodomonas_salina.1
MLKHFWPLRWSGSMGRFSTRVLMAPVSYKPVLLPPGSLSRYRVSYQAAAATNKDRSQKPKPQFYPFPQFDPCSVLATRG